MSCENAAPDWTPGYPSSGAVIGPLWKLAWEVLCAAGRPLRPSDVVPEVLRQVPDANPKTISKLIYHAGKAGALERVRVPGVKRREAWGYRLPEDDPRG